MENMENKVDTTIEVTEEVLEVIETINEVAEVVKKDALSILNEELEKEHGKMLPVKPILTYLITKCENDNEFSLNVEKGKKSFEECKKYLVQEIKKLLNKQNGYLPEQDVYDLAENYYISDDIVIEEPKKVVHNTTPRPNTQAKTHSVPRVSAAPPKAKEPEEEQISLFML